MADHTLVWFSFCFLQPARIIIIGPRSIILISFGLSDFNIKSFMLNHFFMWFLRASDIMLIENVTTEINAVTNLISQMFELHPHR